MVDVLLIQPPIRDFYLTAKRTLPYGLAAIAGAVMEHGFSVEILDGLATSKSRPIALPEPMSCLKRYYGRSDRSPFSLFHQYRHFGYSFEHLARMAREKAPLLIGISSLFSAYSQEALHTAAVVKAACPQSAIVLGGHHPTIFPEAVLADGAVDYVLRGEGEVSLPALIHCLKTGQDLDAIPGIAFYRKSGELVLKPPASMDELDAFPPPALDLVSHRYYRRENGAGAVVTASRGCPMRCSYCSLGDSSIYPYRRRNLESVLAEIDTWVKRFGAGFIDFEDENISMDRRWFKALLKALTDRYGTRGPELRAMNGLYPPSLDQEMIQAMAGAGFKTLNLALATTAPDQLARFQRPDVREAFERALCHAGRCGLGAVGYLIAGAPGQSAADSLEDLLYLAGQRVLAGVSVFYPAPGSANYRRLERSGHLPGDFSLMRSSALPIGDTTSRLEAVTLLRLGRILNFMKSLMDEGRPMPRSASLPADWDSASARDRREVGIRLLQAFLDDGKILGITACGAVYEHEASSELVTGFLNGIKSIQLVGCR